MACAERGALAVTGDHHAGGDLRRPGFGRTVALRPDYEAVRDRDRNGVLLDPRRGDERRRSHRDVPRRRSLAGRAGRGPATLAKGLAAGYTPFGAVLAPNRIVDPLRGERGALHGTRISTNPLSCAVAHAW